jgi:hypothetical protein
VDDAIDQDPHLPPGASMLFYPAALPLSRFAELAAAEI